MNNFNGGGPEQFDSDGSSYSDDVEITDNSEGVDGLQGFLEDPFVLIPRVPRFIANMSLHTDRRGYQYGRERNDSDVDDDDGEPTEHSYLSRHFRHYTEPFIFGHYEKVQLHLMVLSGVMFVPTQEIPLRIVGRGQVRIIRELLAGNRTFGVLLFPHRKEGVTAEIVASHHDRASSPRFDSLGPSEIFRMEDGYFIKFVGRQRFVLDHWTSRRPHDSRTSLDNDIDLVQVRDRDTISIEKRAVTILPHDEAPPCPLMSGYPNECHCSYERNTALLTGTYSAELGVPSNLCVCPDPMTAVPWHFVRHLNPKNLTAKLIVLLDRVCNSAAISDADAALAHHIAHCKAGTKPWLDGEDPKGCSTTTVGMVCSENNPKNPKGFLKEDVARVDPFAQMVFAKRLESRPASDPKRTPFVRSFLARLALEVARTSGVQMFIFWLTKNVPIFEFEQVYDLLHGFGSNIERLQTVIRILESRMKLPNSSEACQELAYSCYRCRWSPEYLKILRNAADSLFCATCGAHVTNLRFLFSMSRVRRKRMRNDPDRKVSRPACAPPSPVDREEAYLSDPMVDTYNQYLFSMTGPSASKRPTRFSDDDDGEESVSERAEGEDALAEFVREVTEEETLPGDTCTVFVNAHKITFEVMNFNHASVRSVDSSADPYFSWYPNYAWHMVKCRHCLAHLGWEYIIPYRHSFRLMGPGPSDVYPAAGRLGRRSRIAHAPAQRVRAANASRHSAAPSSMPERRTFGRTSLPSASNPLKREALGNSEFRHPARESSFAQHHLYNSLHSWEEDVVKPRVFFGLDRWALTFKRPTEVRTVDNEELSSSLEDEMVNLLAMVSSQD